MGTDYNCGCRTSMDAWFLCDRHEAMMQEELIKEIEQEKKSSDGWEVC